MLHNLNQFAASSINTQVHKGPLFYACLFYALFLFSFNAPCQFTPLQNPRSLIFVSTPLFAGLSAFISGRFGATAKRYYQRRLSGRMQQLSFHRDGFS
jgi:hypothetical protein